MFYGNAESESTQILTVIIHMRKIGIRNVRCRVNANICCLREVTVACLIAVKAKKCHVY